MTCVLDENIKNMRTFLFCRNDEDETECVISKGTVTQAFIKW